MHAPIDLALFSLFVCYFHPLLLSVCSFEWTLAKASFEPLHHCVMCCLFVCMHALCSFSLFVFLDGVLSSDWFLVLVARLSCFDGLFFEEWNSHHRLHYTLHDYMISIVDLSMDYFRKSGQVVAVCIANCIIACSWSSIFWWILFGRMDQRRVDTSYSPDPRLD